MDSDTSRSSPPRHKQERVRVQKIRNCCDACSISKTKCDQTRPSCGRCQKNGIDCNYSVSQRKGKPPAASRNPSNGMTARRSVQEKHTPEPIRPSIETSRYDIIPDLVGTPNFSFDHDTSMTDMFFSNYEDSVPPFGTPIPPEVDHFTPSYAMTPTSMFDHDLSALSTPNMDRSSSHSSTDNYFSLFQNHLGPQPTSTPADFSLSPNPLPTPMSSEAQSPVPRSDCAKLASSTLESLNINAQACKYACTMEPNNSASLDQILIATKSAVENAHELLSCPCAVSQQSTLMISCIIDKILGLYQSTIRAETYATAVLRPSTPDSISSNGRRVSPTPIMIGAYQMDAKDEQRMRMQLVSNEVRKAGALVDRYAEKYRAQTRQHGEDASVASALTNLLRKRLREAGGDVNNALRNL